MPDRFTLLTFSLSLILHNVSSSKLFHVSSPLNHMLNEDGSVSVTCEYDEPHSDWEWDAKLKMNSEVVCEVFNKTNIKDAKCDYEHEDNKFKFTLKKLEARYKNQLFSCVISRVSPLPIKTEYGEKTMLFEGCNIPFPPPGRTCSCPTAPSELKNCSPIKVTSPEQTNTLLMGGLIVAVVLLFLYSVILTGVYIRLRVTKVEPNDNLTYVPMQRKVRPHDADNTEYVDMREVQKQGGNIRDINYNC